MNVNASCSAILNHQAKHAAAVQRQIDPLSGRFLGKEGGFAIGSQGVLLPLAMLYQHPSSKLHRNEDVLNDAMRVGDALRDFQNPNGSWEFIKEDGSSWGPTHMPWPFLPWLETFALLSEQLGAERKENWTIGLRKWCDANLRQTTKSLAIHNIPAYNAAILTRAATLLDAPNYLEPAAEYLRRVADDQHPDGFWAEGGMPTCSYNMVYGHALGLYYACTKDEYVLPHLRRLLDFHLHFTYPDGTHVETIDGRVRYNKHPATMGLLGFLPFPDGRSLAQLKIERALAKNGTSSLDAGLFFVLPHLTEAASVEIPQTQSTLATIYKQHASIRRSGSFFCCLNAYTPPLADRLKNSRTRWLMDMQHLVSIWHEQTGLIVGGGNSKHQPEFSTFEVFVGGAHYIQPDTATVHTTEKGEDILELKYGPVTCELAVTVPTQSDGSVRMRFRANSEIPGADIRAGFTLFGVAGKELNSSNNAQSKSLDPKHSTELVTQSKELLSVGNIELKLPTNTNFNFPTYPFNPYAIEGVSQPQSTVASIYFKLEPNNEYREVTLRILPEAPASD